MLICVCVFLPAHVHNHSNFITASRICTFHAICNQLCFRQFKIAIEIAMKRAITTTDDSGKKWRSTHFSKTNRRQTHDNINLSQIENITDVSIRFELILYRSGLQAKHLIQIHITFQFNFIQVQFSDCL